MAHFNASTPSTGKKIGVLNTCVLELYFVVSSRCQSIVNYVIPRTSFMVVTGYAETKVCLFISLPFIDVMVMSYSRRIKFSSSSQFL